MYIKQFLQKRPGFTLVELLLAISILSVLATIAVLTLEPIHYIEKTEEALRSTHIKEIQHAAIQYVLSGNKLAYIDDENGSSLTASALPSSAADAVDICRTGVTAEDCSSAGGYDLSTQIVPTYIYVLPVDPAAERDEALDDRFTGYLIWKDKTYIGVCSHYGSFACVPIESNTNTSEPTCDPGQGGLGVECAPPIGT